MPSRWRHAAVTALLLALAACGGSDGADPARPAGNARPSSRPTVAELATKLTASGIPCGPLTPRPEVFFTREEAECDSGGRTLTLSTFNNNEARDNYHEIAAGFGSIMVLGHEWSVIVPDDAMGRRVADALGGELR